MVSVSIITSAHNEQEHLEAAISSVLRQTLRDWEWVIVDDGSTDGTWEILARWAEREGRIRLLRNERREGLSRSLNKAISASSGPYLARMDADDLCRPDRLRRQWGFLEKNPSVGVVGSFNHVLDPEGKVLETWRFQHTPEEIHYTLQFQNCLCHSSVMLRRELLEDVGLYREDLTAAQDYDLWLRASHRTALYKIPEPLVSWRLRPGGVSVERRGEQTRLARQIALANLGRLVGEEVPPGFLATVLGREIPRGAEERSAFFGLLERVHRAMTGSAPQGVDRERLAGLCRHRTRVLEMAFLWRGGPRERYLGFASRAILQPRLLAEVRHHLRRAKWTLG